MSNGGTSATSTHAASGGGTYVVKPGDTLYRIARSNNVDVESIKRWNNLTDPNQLTVGQVLKLSAAGGTAVATAPPVTGKGAQARPLDQKDETGNAGTPAAPSSTQPEPLPPPPQPGTAPAQPPETPPPQNGAATTPPPSAPEAVSPAQPARAADANLINWAWPAKGPIVQAFSSNSKGIDIGGSLGDPVTAAADGKVMYSGNGVRGLGNLIIISHSNGFITAYAHNQVLQVKTGQDVKRGAKIAELGQTDAPSPRLHFEIRRQGTPVDPLQYLPPR
jgi:lipoprotein NlpD